MTPLTHRIADLMFPLDEFYVERGDSMPAVEPVDAALVPPPYRDLLVHDRDMTTTLEDRFGGPISLRLLEVRRDGSWLRRQVVLLRDADERPVEYGAIRIDLSAFAPGAVRSIIECRRPLGAILHEHKVEHQCRPSAFFRFRSDPTTRSVFALRRDTTLYGRHTLLYDGGERTLAEVVEILPPIESSDSP